MSEDHLDKEIAVSADLTETGFKAGAKSRALAAFDRLVGNFGEWANVRLEGDISRRRAIIEGEKALIEATVRHGIQRLDTDDDFAARAFETHFSKIARAQANKDGVVRAALSDLRRSPIADSQADDGVDTLSSEFLDRLETYAEGASSEELRERWGRVLASELRKPGTFGRKVLRVTDELSAETAKVFEQLCSYRVGHRVFYPIMPEELSFAEKIMLISAGLMVDPLERGHVGFFVEVDLTAGNFWMLRIGNEAVGIRKGAAITYAPGSILMDSAGTPAVRVFILSDAGAALASILEDNTDRVREEVFGRIKEMVPSDDLVFFTTAEDGHLTAIKP